MHHPVGQGGVCGAPEDLMMRCDTHEAAVMSFYGNSPEEVLRDVHTSQEPLPHGSRTCMALFHSSPGAQYFLCLTIRSTETSVHTALLPFRC